MLRFPLKDSTMVTCIATCKVRFYCLILTINVNQQPKGTWHILDATNPTSDENSSLGYTAGASWGRSSELIYTYVVRMSQLNF